MASFNWVAFWNMDAELIISLLVFMGGPRGGKSACCRLGVAAFELELELLPDWRLEDELDPELRDLVKWAAVFVRFTIRLDGSVLRGLSAAVALVKVKVKYCVSSMLQTEMIQDTIMA